MSGPAKVDLARMIRDAARGNENVMLLMSEDLRFIEALCKRIPDEVIAELEADGGHALW